MADTRRHGPRLEMWLLGPPRVAIGGRPLDVDTRKAVAILALLGAEGRPFAREELAALLWPDSDDVAARGALRRTLSTMRAAMGDLLLVDRASVDVDRRRLWVDLAVVEVAAGSDDRETLAAAADLARGAFLAGFSLRDSAEFDDWRAARAVAAERSVLTVLDRLVAKAEADGDLPAAIVAGGRRLDIDPLDEGGHVRLMELHAAAGDRSAALRQYRACVAILERELGVVPLASTTARYEAIRDREVEPAVAPRPVATRRTAPPPVTPRRLPLVGRATEVAVACDAWAAATSERSGRAIAIVGEAGIGKTRLGETIADEVRAAGGPVISVTAYPAERSIAYGPVVDALRQAHADVAGRRRLEAVEPTVRIELARLLPAIATHGAGPPPDGPGAHARLVAAIADGLTTVLSGSPAGLLWIDDVQWLDGPTSEAIGYLLQRLQGRPITVALAWRPGDLDAEGTTFADRVLGAAETTVLTPGRLGRDEVAALIAASGVDAAVAPEALDRLVAASEGLPLYVTEALSADGGIAETLPAGVGTVLRARLAAVDETTSQVLVAGSVIGRSFDAATVRSASGRTEDETVDALDEAVRRGLIREGPAGFDFVHGALRDLAYASTSLARRRLLHRRVAEALRSDRSAGARGDLATLVLIADHERAAGRDGEAAEAYRAAGRRAAELFANDQAVAHDEAALALGHPDAIGLHVEIGRLRTTMGDYAGAIAAFEAAAALADAARLPAIERSIARVHLRRGDLVAASRHLDAAAEGAAGDRPLLARIRVDQGLVRRRMADPDGAASAAAQALELTSAAEDPEVVGAAHRLRGLAALDAGDPGRAVDELTVALAAAAGDPDPAATIAARTGLAMATAAAGDPEAAMAHGAAALTVCRRIGDRHLEAAVENHLADLLHAAGRDEVAMDHLRRAVEAFAEVGAGPSDPDPGIWMLSMS